MSVRLRHRTRGVRARGALALGSLALLAVGGTMALWNDAVPVSGSTISAATVPPATSVACQVGSRDLTGFFHTLTVTATVPTDSRYGYVVQLARLASPDTVIWSHAPSSVDGSTLTYNFVDADITVDQPTQGLQSIDYTVRILVRVQNSPSWTSTVATINVDASNAGALTFDVIYGSPTGTTNINGNPGHCAIV